MNTPGRDSQIAIIGAGITGLALAYYLSKAGYRVTVFEKKEKSGGFLDSIPLNGGIFLEKYYHHIIGGFDELSSLLEDIGMGQDIVWEQARMGILCDRRVFPFNGIFDLLRFKPLSVMNRLRFGFNVFRLSRIKDWRKLDNYTAETILKEYCGEEAWRKIWEPLLKMKFGDNFNAVSATWICERVKARRKSQGIMKARERFGYINGGFYRIVARLSEAVRASGGEVLLSSEVTGIYFNNNTAVVKCAEKEMVFSRVVSTIPLPYFLNIAGFLTPREVTCLKNVRYQNVLCLLVRLKRPLTEFYWVSIIAKDIPFVVAVEHTNFMKSSDYGGESIIYLVRYCSADDTFFNLEEAKIKERGIEALRKISVSFNQNDIIDMSVFRNECAQPVFVAGYADIKNDLSLVNKRVILADSSQLYPASRSTNSAVSLAGNIVKGIILNL